jgi:putative cell wall-binding protein
MRRSARPLSTSTFAAVTSIVVAVASLTASPMAAQATVEEHGDAPAPAVEEVLEKGVHRIGGDDRYAVSAAVAMEQFVTAPVVYVASGEGYADALSASAVAGAQRAPVLLVSKSEVPARAVAALNQLNPDVIVIVGGASSVSSDVEADLENYAGDVERVTGDDRYAVSARLSSQALWAPNPVAYVASGEVFPDALSASAGAGQLGGPVLLVKKYAIPGAIGLELARLKPSKLVVLGGENTISTSTFTSLKEIVRDTTRIGKADRYLVSAATSEAAFPVGAKTVFIASGQVFPDALSGSAAAIRAHGPVLLTLSDTIPPAIAEELTRLKPDAIVVLGGERTITERVREALKTYIVP